MGIPIPAPTPATAAPTMSSVSELTRHGFTTSARPLCLVRSRRVGGGGVLRALAIRTAMPTWKQCPPHTQNQQKHSGGGTASKNHREGKGEGEREQEYRKDETRRRCERMCKYTQKYSEKDVCSIMISRPLQITHTVNNVSLSPSTTEQRQRRACSSSRNKTRHDMTEHRHGVEFPPLSIS